MYANQWQGAAEHCSPMMQDYGTQQSTTWNWQYTCRKYMTTGADHMPQTLDLCSAKITSYYVYQDFDHGACCHRRMFSDSAVLVLGVVKTLLSASWCRVTVWSRCTHVSLYSRNSGYSSMNMPRDMFIVADVRMQAQIFSLQQSLFLYT